MSKLSKVSVLLFVLLVAGCAGTQPPRPAVDVPGDKDPVVYDY
jgi:hypothetical protein